MINVRMKLVEAHFKLRPESEDCNDLVRDTLEVFKRCMEERGDERECLWEAADEFVLGIDSLGHQCAFPEELRRVAERLGVNLDDLLAL